MGKRAKRSDPLQPRASRVKKARRTYTRRTLPSWYYRVLKLRWETSYFDEFKDPRDFDEDLSELEEQSQQGCKCGGDDYACDCGQFSDDHKSERSYDGSEADTHLGYYDLKEQREQRKREKLQERKKKEERLEFEKSKENEVRAAYRSLRKAEEKNNVTSLGPLLDQEFDLFCSDHVEYLYDSDTLTPKRVAFYEPEESDVNQLKHDDKSGFLSGWLDLDDNVQVELGLFRPRTNASWKPLKVKSMDRRYELSFQFISDNYLKLRVSRDMVFSKSPGGPPTTAPAFFDFVGIWMDPVEEMAKMEEEREKDEMEERLRAAPTHESWFELNHPMGKYGPPRW